MMENLLRRGEGLASERQRTKIRDVAEQLRAIFGSAAVHVDDTNVLVSGRGIIKRWLVDPAVRFLAGGLK